MKRFLPFLPINQHGVIGDRQTAALIAADGTMDWLCFPDYDEKAIFASLLDPCLGGFWRIGPSHLRPGKQLYSPDTAILTTQWQQVRLIDTFVWDGAVEKTMSESTLIRHLQCGTMNEGILFSFFPRYHFRPIRSFKTKENELSFSLGRLNFPLLFSHAEYIRAVLTVQKVKQVKYVTE